MQFNSVDVQHLAGLQPVDGVFKLEGALRQIDDHLGSTSPSSPSYIEFQTLKELYTKYLNEAKQLRQKGMDSFRKYLAMKNNVNNTNNNTTHQSQPQSITTNNNINNININNNNNLSTTTATAATTAATATTTSTNKISQLQNIEQTQSIQIQTAALNNGSHNNIELMEENCKLRQEIKELIQSKQDYEETEHELRLILEEYKFTQLSHKQQINNLQNTISTYKKASDSKTKSLDTLNNELETIKNNNKLITKQNTQLKQQITQYINENTNLKERLIENNNNNNNEDNDNKNDDNNIETLESAKTNNNNYIITKEEYLDIEKVIDDRDKYLNKVLFYENRINILSGKYNELQLRLREICEEKSLMMKTLKCSVEKLANDNNLLQNKMNNLNDERSCIKQHDLQTQNDFYDIFQENKERKYSMNEMKEKIKLLNDDINTFKYLSKQLKENNNKLNQQLTDSLERIQKLVEDKDIISKKLRESNKLTQEILKERKKNNNNNNKDKDEDKDNDNDTGTDYELLLNEKLEIEKMFNENEGTVNELTNQIIELENKLRRIELENELLRKEIKQIRDDNQRKTNQIKSAQRVALSIMQSNKGNININDRHLNEKNNKDMFGLQPPAQPDLITSLLTYLLPFLFEEDDQPKIV